MKKLEPKEYLRYARHLTLKEVGQSGQEKLKNAKVLVIGAGGLGSPILLYLAAAGVGHIGIVEFDNVDQTNLQRQILYGESQVGQSKSQSSKKRLEDLNPYIKIELFELRIDVTNIESIIKDFSIIVDGTDNFSTRYLVNDACYFQKKPLVSGSILSFEGQLSVFNYKNGPCYRCLYPSPPPIESAPNCSEAGVLGVLPGMLGTMQATEVLKIILEIGVVSSGVLIHFDALYTQMSRLNIERDKLCPLCGEQPIIKTLIQLEEVCSTDIGREISQENFFENKENICLIDVREDFEREICVIENSQHIPLNNLKEKIELIRDEKRPIVFYCESGRRSLKAVKILEEFKIKSSSLTGGILAFIKKFDSSKKKH